MKGLLGLVFGVVFAGCASPEPPSRTPDFVGLVVAVDGAGGARAHLVIELAPATPYAFPTLMPGPGRSAVRAELTLAPGLLNCGACGATSYWKRHSESGRATGKVVVKVRETAPAA